LQWYVNTIFIHVYLIFTVFHLKHSTGRDQDIIFIPQPSESPRDPLNWSLRRRDSIFLIFCINSAVISCWTYMLTSAYGVLAEDFKIVYTYFTISLLALWGCKRTVRMDVFYSRISLSDHQWSCSQVRKAAFIPYSKHSIAGNIHWVDLCKELENIPSLSIDRKHRFSTI
jgi:hypothetical protein